MKKTFYILIFISLSNLTVGQTKVGLFKSVKGGSRLSTIDVKQDGSYTANNFDCTYRFKTTGKWAEKNDTLLLTYEKIYRVRGNNKTYELKDTANISYRVATSMTKYLIREDTLILLYNSKKWSWLMRSLSK